MYNLVHNSLLYFKVCPFLRCSVVLVTVGFYSLAMRNCSSLSTKVARDCSIREFHSNVLYVILVILQDLFFKYSWNNFLHTQVERCIYTILNNPPTEEDGELHTPLIDTVSITYTPQMAKVLPQIWNFMQTFIYRYFHSMHWFKAGKFAIEYCQSECVKVPNNLIDSRQCIALFPWYNCCLNQQVAMKVAVF